MQLRLVATSSWLESAFVSLEGKSVLLQSDLVHYTMGPSIDRHESREEAGGCSCAARETVSDVLSCVAAGELCNVN